MLHSKVLIKAPSKLVSVKSLRWLIRGELEGPRESKRFGRVEESDLGTKQDIF